MKITMGHLVLMDPRFGLISKATLESRMTVGYRVNVLKSCCSLAGCNIAFHHWYRAKSLFITKGSMLNLVVVADVYEGSLRYVSL